MEGYQQGIRPAENAWNAAYNQYYKDNNANLQTVITMLSSEFTKFNKNLAMVAGYSENSAIQNMPMSLDFDIEGAAQYSTKENRFLTKTLAFMKKLILDELSP